MKLEVMPKQTTRCKYKHTKCPKGYIEWMSWADSMVKSGHKQIRCPDCDLFHIWVKMKKKIRKG